MRQLLQDPTALGAGAPEAFEEASLLHTPSQLPGSYRWLEQGLRHCLCKMDAASAIVEQRALCRMCQRPYRKPLHPVRSVWPRSQASRRLSARAAAAPLRSFDDSDLDDEVASEFSRHSNPELLRRHAKRLELVWNVGKVPGPCTTQSAPV